MPDLIRLTGLQVRGSHGVLADERRTGQVFVIDAELEVDTAPAAVSGALADTVDYAELAQRLAAVVGGPPVDLIETLAARLCGVCLEHRLVGAATVTVHKPHAPIDLVFTDVSVTIRRTSAGPV